MHSSFVRSCLVSFSLAVISWLVKIYRLFENCVFHPVRCYPLFFSVLFYRLSARTDLERRDKSPDRKTFRNVVSSFIRRSGAKYVVKLTNCADVLMRIFLRRSFTLRRIGALYLSRRHSSILFDVAVLAMQRTQRRLISVLSSVFPFFSLVSYLRAETHGGFLTSFPDSGVPFSIFFFFFFPSLFLCPLSFSFLVVPRCRPARNHYITKMKPHDSDRRRGIGDSSAFGTRRAFFRFRSIPFPVERIAAICYPVLLLTYLSYLLYLTRLFPFFRDKLFLLFVVAFVAP